MNFEIGSRYRHVNCLDIDIEIEDVYIGHNLDILYSVTYYNRHWRDGEFIVYQGDLVQFNDREASRWIKL